MRSVLFRPNKRLLLAAGAALMLAACRGEPGLPSAEVLDRAAHAAQQLESALFKADVAMNGADSGTFSTSIHAEGRLQNAGHQWDFNARMRLQNGTESSWDITADVIVIDESEIYIRAQEVRADPPSAFPLPLPADALQKWLKMPSAPQAPAPDVTPDPKFLAMQASVVQVTRDRGIVRLGDQKVYHYDVAIDPEKLRAFLKEVAVARGEEFHEEDVRSLLSDTDLTGQLWIDASTFQVLRVQWNATPVSENGYQGSLTVELRDHNKAPPIVPPDGAVPLEQLLGMPGAAPSFLDAGSLSGEEQQQLLQLLDQQK